MLSPVGAVRNPLGATASCQTTTFCVPDGTFLISKFPFSSVTAKYGLFTTIQYAFIHGWMSQTTSRGDRSASLTAVVWAAWGDRTMLEVPWARSGALTLWPPGSLFFTSPWVPASTARMCGVKAHFSWSNSILADV